MKTPFDFHDSGGRNPVMTLQGTM